MIEIIRIDNMRWKSFVISAVKIKTTGEAQIKATAT